MLPFALLNFLLCMIFQTKHIVYNNVIMYVDAVYLQVLQ